MDKEELRKEKARADFEDSLKEQCGRCGNWAIVDQHGLCDSCGEEGFDDEDGDYEDE